MKYLYIILSMITNMKHPLFGMIPHGTAKTYLCQTFLIKLQSLWEAD